jgi:cathepsin L
VLEAHHELYQGGNRTFSVQQIISCTPNPEHCGGSGGCGGATPALALAYVSKAGCRTEAEFPGSRASGFLTKADNLLRPITRFLQPVADAVSPLLEPVTGSLVSATQPKCPEDLKLEQRQPAVSSSSSSLVEKTGGSVFSGRNFGMEGYKSLPRNQLEPLLRALVEKGPVAVSLAAGEAWNWYGSGILDACERDAVIDHSVVLAGYGDDSESGTNYWLLMNSWGNDWGENGFVRLQRFEHEEESQYCGWDLRPELGIAFGSGCQGGPAKVRVCGTCGLLYDAALPAFRLGEHGWWSH